MTLDQQIPSRFGALGWYQLAPESSWWILDTKAESGGMHAADINTKNNSVYVFESTAYAPGGSQSTIDRAFPGATMEQLITIVMDELIRIGTIDPLEFVLCVEP